MDKKTFLNMFQEYDKNYISSIFEDIELCKSIDVPICTKEFVTPDIYYKLKAEENKLGVTVLGSGAFEECERRVLCFSTDPRGKHFYDYKILKIINKSKFKVLSHKDYLGSLMALGLKRELFGDLVVNDSKCYLPVSSSVAEYILSNFNTVGKCPCEVVMINIEEEKIPAIDFEERFIIATSLRLDNIVASLCNISRSKAIELIDGGIVLLNYLCCSKKDKLIKEEDTITIRKYGKFKLKQVLGETAKGRLKLSFSKYR